MVDKSPRIALLIDADNSPAAKIGVILNELSTFGETSIRRAYGNWKKQELRGWEEILHEHAIRPIQQFDYSKGKNASDMAMVIDALDLLYSDRPGGLRHRLVRRRLHAARDVPERQGRAVYGFGGQKTPEPFVNACSRFLSSTSSRARLDHLGRHRHRRAGARRRRRDAAACADRQTAPRRQARRPAPQRDRGARKGESGWARVGAVRQQIGNQASFDSAQLRLRDAHQAAQGDRPVPARKGRHSEVACATCGRPAPQRPDAVASRSTAAKKKGGSEEPLLWSTIGARRLLLRRFARGRALRRRLGSRRTWCRPWSSTCARRGWWSSRSSRWSSFIARGFSPAGLSSPAARSALVVALRSARVLSDIVDGCFELVPGPSPAGAGAPVLASALTSARVGDEAWANAPCENTATAAAATAPRTNWSSSEYLLIIIKIGKGHFMSRRSAEQA